MVKVGSLFKQGLSLISRQEFDRPVIRHRAEHGAKGAVKLQLEPFEHGGDAADEPADVSGPVAMARFAVRHSGRRAGVSAIDVILRFFWTAAERREQKRRNLTRKINDLVRNKA